MHESVKRACEHMLRRAVLSLMFWSSAQLPLLARSHSQHAWAPSILRKHADQVLILRLWPNIVLAWFPCLHHSCLPDALMGDHALVLCDQPPPFFHNNIVCLAQNLLKKPKNGTHLGQSRYFGNHLSRNGLKCLKKWPWFIPRAPSSFIICWSSKQITLEYSAYSLCTNYAGASSPHFLHKAWLT